VPSLGAGVVEHTAHVVEDLARVDAAADELRVGRLDVDNGELQSLNRARRGRRDPSCR
jgi:hypothetical protein